ncbi:tetratricopeptide repeat protein [Planococcus lenghuensis]|uniref:Uncharacterized protein n=1 Tax=Planococcus lenghuensis TaxID=2213202 RepID=A0A1Q2KXK3_9BACL|nr:tetratricopeptide repeat protein [Planococcus lenghuensis]AQQ52931.1 hypothetical protein B0X71_07395 [Planococcus lenghuensis]
MDYNETGIRALQDGRYEEAVAAFTKAIEQEPDNPLGYINFGHVLAATGDTERAERFFQKALTLGESATAYYGLANLYFNEDRYEEALKLYEKAIQLGIEGPDAHYMMGKSLERLQQPKLALPYLQRAVELDGEDTDARMSYGIALATLELFDLAEPEFQQVLIQEPEHADAHYNLGVLYAVSTENTDAALSHLKRAFTIDENHDQARYVHDMILQRLN